MTIIGVESKQRMAEKLSNRKKLEELLAKDLGFHDEDSSTMSHDFHAFPAKFPPQLPRVFIEQLTSPEDWVLDPMMGSGTTVVEAIALNRNGIGFDIDPLATLLSKVKVNAIGAETAQAVGLEIIGRAEYVLNNGLPSSLESQLAQRFDSKTRNFVDYWFSVQTQMELLALIQEIENVSQPEVREFLQLVFSAIIITKSGGVSLAWDLAHTRPHKLKQGISKSYKSAIKEFRRKLSKNVAGLRHMVGGLGKAHLSFGNAHVLPLKNTSVDLVFTSSPYALNAIDYMRAHKFSLVWFGRHIDHLTDLRSRYIGGETVSNFQFTEMPPETCKILERIAEVDKKKGFALHRYYSEMHQVLSEAFRVLKPGKAAIIVVGSSTVRGINAAAHHCVGEIGSSLGFELVHQGRKEPGVKRRAWHL